MSDQLSEDERKELAQLEAGIDQHLAAIRDAGKALLELRRELGRKAFEQICREKGYLPTAVEFAISTYTRSLAND